MDKESGLEELQRRREVSLQMGGLDRIERHHQRGYLTARERIDKLLDPATFVETGLLEQYEIPGGGGKMLPTSRITGFGKIDGRTIVVHADDRTVFAGTDAQKPTGLPLRGPNVSGAKGPGYPVVTLGDGGGGSIKDIMGSAGIMARAAPVRGYQRARQAPRIHTIMGYCFGGSSFGAIASDIVVMVKKGTCMAVSGPRTLEVALSERTTPEELGGWQVHAEVTGQVDAFAEDEEHCFQIVREVLSYLPSNCNEEPPYVPTEDPPERRVDAVMDILPDKSNRVYDMHKIIQTIVDDGKYLSIKPYFGKAVITCLARMNGRSVGIIANQTMHNAGAPGPDESAKATSFIVLCDSYNIPLIFLTDTPGNLVGVDAERRKLLTGLIVWMEALAFVTVPKLAIILRKAYGLALSNMCSGKDTGADILAAWPTADISFMSPEAATNVAFYRQIQEAEDPQAEKERLLREMAYANAPFHAAADGTIDDIIDPRDTRKYIIEQLDLMRGARGDFISEKKLQNWPTGF